MLNRFFHSAKSYLKASQPGHAIRMFRTSKTLINQTLLKQLTRDNNQTIIKKLVKDAIAFDKFGNMGFSTIYHLNKLSDEQVFQAYTQGSGTEKLQIRDLLIGLMNGETNLKLRAESLLLAIDHVRLMP